MARLTMTREGLAKYCKIKMGHPTVCVELSDDHFEAAVFDSELWIAVHLGQTRRVTLQLAKGTSEYSLPDDCESVVDVAFPGGATGLFPDGFGIEDAEDFFYAQMHPSGRMRAGSNHQLYQSLQHIETTQRTLSGDQDHHWEVNQRKLIIAPANVQGTAIVWYLSDQIDYEMLDMTQKLLMRRYAVASVMMMLGVIRSKFSEIPAAGGKVTLNGSELIASAEGEFSILNEKVKQMTPPLGFLTG